MSYKVSVIIPVYNIEQYVARCLDSVATQSYRNLEIIVVNDGSTDNSGAIVDEYAAKESRIKVIHQENEGVISARRRGILSSTADFVFFVDSDDWLEPDAIELVVKKQLATDADIVVGSYQTTNDKTVIKSHPISANDAITAEEYIPLLLHYKIPCFLWMKLYRKAIFPENFSSFGRHLSMGDDAICNCQLLPYVNKIATEPSAIYNYYQRDTSIAHTYLKKPTIEYDIIMFTAMTDAMGEDIAATHRHIINSRLVVRAISIFFIHIHQFDQSYADTKAYEHIKAIIKADKNITNQLSLKKRVLLVLMSSRFWFNLLFRINLLFRDGKWRRFTPIGNKYETNDN